MNGLVGVLLAIVIAWLSTISVVAVLQLAPGVMPLAIFVLMVTLLLLISKAVYSTTGG